MSVRERDIEATVTRYAKSRNCLIYKFSSPSHRGVCDRIIIAPGGVVGFLELKAPNEEPTPLQAKFLQDVANKGGISSWADSVAKGKAFIDQLIAHALLS